MAGLSIYEWTSTGTRTDKTGKQIVFGLANNASTGLYAALVRPTTPGGFEYSYNKMLRLRIGMTSTEFNTILNLRFYTDGSNDMANGMEVLCKASTWSTPVEKSGTAGYASAFSYRSTSPLSLSTGSFGSSVYHTTGVADVGRFTDLFMLLSTASTRGVSNAETVTWSYDET